MTASKWDRPVHDRNARFSRRNALGAVGAAAVPPYATAAVLVLVGLTMFQMVGTLDFRTLEDSLPPFVTIVLIPLTLSITQGILWGFILHAVLYVVSGRQRELSPTLWVLALISVGLLFLESR